MTFIAKSQLFRFRYDNSCLFFAMIQFSGLEKLMFRFRNSTRVLHYFFRAKAEAVL